MCYQVCIIYLFKYIYLIIEWSFYLFMLISLIFSLYFLENNYFFSFSQYFTLIILFN